ncbi:MAG: hypothetical protein U0821_15210 [Chloroflexota bacterium]
MARDDSVVGVNYFDHQFLRAEDFQTAQDFHVGRLRQHNRVLHRTGVVQGLVVSLADGHLTVSEGAALTSDGFEVVLQDGGTALARFGDGEKATEQRIAIDRDGLRLNPAKSGEDGDDLLISIHREVIETTPSQDPEIEGNTRLLEVPVVEIHSARRETNHIVLAIVERKPDGSVVGVKAPDGRPSAGAALAPGSVDAVALADDAVNSKHVKAGAITDSELRSSPTLNAQRAVTTDHVRDAAITPGKLHPTVLNALVAGFCSFDGNASVVRNALNVAGVTKVALGRYTITWAQPVSPDGPVLVFGHASTPSAAAPTLLARVNAMTASSVEVGLVTTANAPADGVVNVAVFRDLG